MTTTLKSGTRCFLPPAACTDRAAGTTALVSEGGGTAQAHAVSTTWLELPSQQTLCDMCTTTRLPLHTHVTQPIAPQSRQVPAVSKPFRESFLPFWVASGTAAVVVHGAEVGRRQLITRCVPAAAASLCAAGVMRQNNTGSSKPDFECLNACVMHCPHSIPPPPTHPSPHPHTAALTQAPVLLRYRHTSCSAAAALVAMLSRAGRQCGRVCH